jgi:septal ring factor EnvC (AmiA/AmiB activator)
MGLQYVCGVDRMFHFFKTVFKIAAYTAVVIFVLLRSYNFAEAQSSEIGVIMVDLLNVRAQPDTKSPSLMLIPKGTKVRVLEYHNAWLKIMVKDQVGYIRHLKRYVHIITENVSKIPEEAANPANDIKRFQKEARNIDQKIEKKTSELLRFTRRETAIVNSLNDIDLTIDQARKNASSLKSELGDLEKEILKTKNDSDNLQKKIQTSENYAASRLVAIYKLSWLGKIYVLASAQSVYDLFQRKKALEYVMAYDENLWKNLMDSKMRLQQLLVDLNEKKAQKLDVESAYKKQIEAMTREREKRSKILDDIRRKRSLKLAAIESLKQAASDLDQTINALKSEFNRVEPRPKISSKDFSELKGLLNMPVKGKIVSFFGPHRNKKYNVVNFQSGIEIKADRGEPIRAVYGGRVLYAKWFKGYGNMIIIDHGDNYYTIYAHAQELFASQGKTVEKGEVVATVGDTGSMIGPSLHFEIRHHGTPVDPLEWIKKAGLGFSTIGKTG